MLLHNTAAAIICGWHGLRRWDDGRVVGIPPKEFYEHYSPSELLDTSPIALTDYQGDPTDVYEVPQFHENTSACRKFVEALKNLGWNTFVVLENGLDTVYWTNDNIDFSREDINEEKSKSPWSCKGLLWPLVRSGIAANDYAASAGLGRIAWEMEPVIQSIPSEEVGAIDMSDPISAASTAIDKVDSLYERVMAIGHDLQCLRNVFVVLLEHIETSEEDENAAQEFIDPGPCDDPNCPYCSGDNPHLKEGEGYDDYSYGTDTEFEDEDDDEYEEVL